MRVKKYFLPPTWPGSHRMRAQTPAQLRLSGQSAQFAEIRLFEDELDTGRVLIAAIRAGAAHYLGKEEKADD